jgi:hypothetical protein
MAISMVRVKALCSASELELVKASTRQEIDALAAASLRQAETRARKLRDKWRDQVASQRRASKTKAGARDAATNKNSAEKAELFEEVLGRFSTQLAKVEAAGEVIGPMGRRRSTKTASSQSHRASRAEVRSELADAKRSLKTKKKAAPAKSKSGAAAETISPKPLQKAAVAESVVNESQSTTAMTKGADTGPKPKRSSKPVAAGATAIVAGREAQGLHVTKQQQLLASANAKHNRLKAGGMIRIQKNRSAANKRSQGRRDSR